MKKALLAATLVALTIPATPVMAQPYGRDGYNDGYDRSGRYYEPRRVSRRDRVWRGRDGRYYCRRQNGTTGLIIGAAGGALLGRELDGGRNRAGGTIAGAALGGLLGREIDRGGARCR